MLHLIYTEDWIAGRNEILSRVSKKVNEKSMPAVLLVPEQISHEMERRLCECAGDQSSRFAEVLSFTRLASRVFSLAGGGARCTLDGGGRIIAMAAAVEQLRGQLKVFASASGKPEFLTQMVSAIDEFKSCCISAEALRQAAKKSTGALAQKLEELSLLLESYDAICQRGDQDPRDRMTLLLEKMQESVFPETHQFYIDGFSDFTVQEREILKYLLVTAEDITIDLVCKDHQDARPEFETAGRTAFLLLQMAKKAGIPWEITRLPGRADGGLQEIRSALFSGPVRPSDRVRQAAEAVSFGDRWSECTYVAQKIRSLARENRVRYRQVMVVCGDYSGYQPVLDAVFRQYGIPAYFSGVEDILHKSVISTVLTAVDAAAQGLEQETVLQYAKSVLSPLTPDQSDKLENYARLWSIDGNGWTNPWKMHPEGLNVPWDRQSEMRLEELEQIRGICIMPLAKLRTGILKAQNTAEQLESLTDFLKEIRLAERMESLALEYAQVGDLRDSQEMEQLWEILLNALTQMYQLLGESVRDGEAFLRLLRLLLSQYDVGTIPATLDQVTLGAVTDLRRREAKYVFLLGAEEGKLPSYGVSGSVLTEAERETLLLLGVELSGSAAQKMNQELAGIHAVISAATEKLHLTTGGGQGAFLWRRLCALLGTDEDGALGAVDAYGEPWEAAAAFAAANQEKMAERAGVLPVYQALLSSADYGFGKVKSDTIRALYGEKLRLSASQIDKLAECRFAYFMRYGLRAKEQKPAKLDAAQFGIFVHYVLEHTAKDVEAQGGFAAVGLEHVLKIAQSHMERYAEECFQDLQDRSQRESYLFERNLDEVRAVVQELWEELRQSQFRPRGFELEFGAGGAMPPVELKGTQMNGALGGFVDRVDLCTIRGVDYVRVVDYKTGKKNFDYCDILNGIGLQMLLYLFALEQGGAGLFGKELKLAGVLYFPAKMPMIRGEEKSNREKIEKERAKELQRKGLVLKDEEAVLAMNPGRDPKYLPCKWDKEGNVVSGAATQAQWSELREYIYKTVESLMDQISGGCVEPNPYYRGPDNNACRFCEYADACHLDTCGAARPFVKVEENEFWKQIGEGRGNG